MDLKLFEDFLALAETRSFSRAAERRHSAQSAFSRRIQSLERWLGAVLVDRRSSPAQLTPAGEAFQEIAEDTLRGVKHGREEILSITSQITGAISVLCRCASSPMTAKNVARLCPRATVTS